jgi:ABC-2 type transport system permease protein
MKYYAYAKKNFVGRSAYRFDHFMGILDTILNLFLYWCIYKTLFGVSGLKDGISFDMVMTNFILSLGLMTVFTYDQFLLPWKIGSGNIENDLLKPIRFREMALALDLGNIVFNLIFQYIPTLIIANIIFDIVKPVSFFAFMCFLVSITLGFLILWNIAFTIQTLGFWIINVWSVATIKDVLVNILSGAMLPIWFMPEWMQNIVMLTPFPSIYFSPIQIYLGQVSGIKILYIFFQQIIWIIIFYLISEILWNKGVKKLVVQGG